MQKILIIEDDEKTALALCLRLKAHGYATWIAADGVLGLSKATQCKPDLIIMDIGLPAGNGLDLAEHLRRMPETRSIPLIFATASQDPRLRHKVLQRGGVGLLRRPYEPETLVSLVRHALAGVSWRPPPPVSARAEPSATPAKAKPVKRILIVEDDQKVALALSVRMRSAGFDTTIAHDALSGVRSAITDRPDAVVLDISLPAGDGFSVAKRIQAHVPNPLPIIFLTASKRCDFREKARYLGAVAFFEKPYEAEGLVAALRHATA
jgi:DNA-binding response OmpR family regulator